MPRREPHPLHWNGAISEIERDNSVTLYGIEDWTQIRDDPVLRIVPRTAVEDDVPPGEPDDEDGSASTGRDVSA